MVESEKGTRPDLNGIAVLVVDDDPSIVRGMSRVLRALGATVTGVGSTREGRLAIDEAPPDAVLADLELKDGTGLSLLPDYLGRRPEGAFYVITGHGSVANAVVAVRQGARDYFEKPVDALALAERIARDVGVQRGQAGLAETLAPYLRFRDPRMIAELADLPRFARAAEPVLIEGETGTGKELVAHALHGLSPRKDGPFVAVNCGAIPDSMLEAELFGHEKGAFTGADRRHKGRFEQAHEGTLFLDEIGEMPAASQVSLLRVLEERKLTRLGAERAIAIDVRIIAATHRPLDEHVASGLFRQDLLYRLNVLQIRLPPLRERPRDIELLARAFLDNSLKEMGRGGAPPGFSPPALALLESHPWPGNVRELRNAMVRLAVRLPAEVREISVPLLSPVLADAQPREDPRGGVLIPPGTTLADAEWLLIDAALKDSGYNRAEAARRLGIGERTLRRKLNES